MDNNNLVPTSPKRFNKKLLISIVLIVIVASLGCLVWRFQVTKNVPVCGGIAGLSCPAGYECTGMAKYPDAQGICRKTNSSTNTISQTSAKTIESIDFKKFLASKYESADPSKSEDYCPIGSTQLWQSGYAEKSIEYGDINGDGTEEAVVNYRTCQNGTGGSNSEVFTLDSTGNPVNITPDSTSLSTTDYKKFFKGFAGHGYFSIKKSELVFAFPVYDDGDSNANPTGGMTTITFKWNGDKFLYDEVMTVVSQSLPLTCVDQLEAKAVITSLSSYSGTIGTRLEIKGCNFAGFEGDKNAWIENSQGVKGILYGEPGSTSKLLKVTLKSQLCQRDTSYRTENCDAFLNLTPDTYKIWTMPWGENTKSNSATFTIK